jgi:HlyD family secretion protein
MKKGLMSIIAMGVLSVVLSGCGRQAAPVAQPTDAQAAAVAVETATIQTGSLDQAIEVTGNLNSLNDSNISAKVSGKIIRMHLLEGDRVKAGQVIAEQDTGDQRVQLQLANAAIQSAQAQLQQAVITSKAQPDQTDAQIQSARAAVLAAQARLRALQTGARLLERQQVEQEVAAAKANYDWAKIDYENTKKLYEQGAVALAALDAKLAAYNAAQAQYRRAQKTLSLIQEGPRQEEIDAAEQTLRQAEEAYRQTITGKSQIALRQQQVQAARAALEQAKANRHYVQQQIDNAIIRAPYEGAIAQRWMEAGEMAIPGSPVVRLVSMDKLYFEANVPETLIREMKENQNVDVRIDAFPGKTFAGRVARIYPVASEAARDFKVRITIPNVGTQLKPGMFARGKVMINTYRNVPLTPKVAIMESAGKTRVFIVQEGKAQERPVKVRATDTELLYVEGVKPGEKVVIRGQDILSDGQAVNVLNN